MGCLCVFICSKWSHAIVGNMARRKPEKSEAMCQYFDKRGYPYFVVQAGHRRAQQIHWQRALQTAQKENTDRILFTITFYPTTTQLNLSFQKTLNYFKTIQTGFIFLQPSLILFKPDKHVSSFLVRTSFQTNDQPGPKRSIKITDHFTCTCANVIYCITCTFCRKL